MIRKIVFGMIPFCMAGVSFAGDNPTGGTQQGLTLKDLQTKCAELTSNPQLKPFSVTVSCDDLSYGWQQSDSAGTMSLKNLRNVGASVQMKDFQIAHQFFTVDEPDTQVPCSSYRKIQRVVQHLDSQVTCDQLAAITDLSAYCAPIVDERIKADPSIVQSSPTQEIVTLCVKTQE